MTAPSKMANIRYENGDVSTPKHDQIMLWLDGKIREGMGRPPQPTDDTDFALCVEDQRDSDQYSMRDLAALLRSKTEDEIRAAWDAVPKECARIMHGPEITWELPIKAGDRIAGFVDIVVTYACERVSGEFNTTSDWDHKTRTQGPSSFVCRKRTWECEWTRYYEVKTERVSIGETLRQIKAYRELLPLSKNWIVVAPPNADLQRILAHEGIGFIAYE